MCSRSHIASAILALVIAYATLLLYPFRWQPPSLVENGVQKSPGLLTFAKPGIAYTAQAPSWLLEAIRSNQISIDLRLRSLAARQRGPARIFSISEDIHARNLTIGQDGTDLVIRVRTPRTDENGIPPFVVPNALEPGVWHDIHVSIDQGRILVSVNGETIHDQDLPRSPLETWDRSFPLALGNELTGNRPWLGEIETAQVRVGPEETEYAEGSSLVVPRRYWVFHGRRPNFLPMSQTTVRDAVQNILLFTPLGFLLGLGKGRSILRRGLWTIAAAAAISVPLEVLQLPFVGRHSSATDVVLNLAGALIGYVFAVAIRERLPAH